LTLWSISDEVTVEFVTSFFERLKAGMGQIEALTATLLRVFEKGRSLVSRRIGGRLCCMGFDQYN